MLDQYMPIDISGEPEYTEPAVGCATVVPLHHLFDDTTFIYAASGYSTEVEDEQ